MVNYRTNQYFCKKHKRRFLNVREFREHKQRCNYFGGDPNTYNKTAVGAGEGVPGYKKEFKALYGRKI